MGKRTKGEVATAGFIIHSQGGDGDHLATTSALGVGTGLTFDGCRANARFFAAGWNLMNALEEIDGIDNLLGALEGFAHDSDGEGLRNTASRARDLVSAIRTALESKP